MPERPEKCDSCGAMGVVAFGDRALWPRLVTFYSFYCSCGARIESDDYGPLEGAWREQELRERGTWKLVVDPAQHAKCVQLLRPFLGMTAREALQTVREGLTGTHQEMLCCVQALRSAGLQADVAVVAAGVPSEP